MLGAIPASEFAERVRAAVAVAAAHGDAVDGEGRFPFEAIEAIHCLLGVAAPQDPAGRAESFRYCPCLFGLGRRMRLHRHDLRYAPGLSPAVGRGVFWRGRRRPGAIAGLRRQSGAGALTTCRQMGSFGRLLRYACLNRNGDFGHNGARRGDAHRPRPLYRHAFQAKGKCAERQCFGHGAGGRRRRKDGLRFTGICEQHAL